MWYTLSNPQVHHSEELLCVHAQQTYHIALSFFLYYFCVYELLYSGMIAEKLALKSEGMKREMMPNFKSIRAPLD